MSESTHCNKCVAPMSHADNEAESAQGDALCIKCRAAAEKAREEEAVASFCQPLRQSRADWFANIITGSGFKFSRRLPADVNETAMTLFYSMGALQMQCHASMPRVTLTRPCAGFPTQPDWVIELCCPTPERVVLATIKAALAE